MFRDDGRKVSEVFFFFFLYYTMAFLPVQKLSCGTKAQHCGPQCTAASSKNHAFEAMVPV